MLTTPVAYTSFPFFRSLHLEPMPRLFPDLSMKNVLIVLVLVVVGYFILYNLLPLETSPLLILAVLIIGSALSLALWAYYRQTSLKKPDDPRVNDV